MTNPYDLLGGSVYEEDTQMNLWATVGSHRSRLLMTLAAVAITIIGLMTWWSSGADALSNGVAFGAYAAPIDGLTNQTAIKELEDQLGVTLPMVRTFGDWDDAIGQGKPLHRWIRDGDRELMASIKPQRENGQEVEWRAIATAQPGSKIHNEMVALAQGVKSYGDSMILGFHHEPEHAKNQSFGDSDDYKAAFRKLHDVFDSQNVTNVRFAWIMTAWSFEVGDIRPDDRRVADRWYPGDDVVDYISVQEYNWATCRDNNDTWESLEAGLEPFMRFARKHTSKKLILSEFGSPEGSSGEKADWIGEARALFKKAEYKDRFAAILYFHFDDRAAGNNSCDWWLDSSNSSLQAARRLAQDNFYQTRVLAGTPAQPAPPPQPAAPTAPLCYGRRATIVGTSGADRLTGTSGVDVIHGLGGNDAINGLTGNDVICGGYGDDTLLGSGGSDVLLGGPGADVMLGGYGPDLLFGGKGADRMNGQHGNDTVSGNEGTDVLRGGPHQDTVNGGGHNDLVLGQGGADTLHGGMGNDRLLGGVGPDRLTGGPGADRCDGGPGRNTLNC